MTCHARERAPSATATPAAANPMMFDPKPIKPYLRPAELDFEVEVGDVVPDTPAEVVEVAAVLEDELVVLLLPLESIVSMEFDVPKTLM
jgi:hypothetical protein